MTHGGTVSDSVLIGAFLFLENVLYIVKIFKKIIPKYLLQDQGDKEAAKRYQVRHLPGNLRSSLSSTV